MNRKRSNPEDEAAKYFRGTHVAVPVELLRELVEAGICSYAPAFGGCNDRPWNAAIAADNIIERNGHRRTYPKMKNY